MVIGIKKIILIALVGMMVMPTVSLGDESEDLIKYRRAVMKAIGGHMSATSLIVRGKVPDKGQLKNHANALKVLTNDIPALFPVDSDFGETRAKESVWTKRKDFENAAKASRDSTVNLVKIIEAGNKKDWMNGFKKAGEACKGCHKDFREKDE